MFVAKDATVFLMFAPILLNLGVITVADNVIAVEFKN